MKNSTDTWILVANRADAKLFVRHGLGRPKLLETIPHPEGKLRSGDINSDKSGRQFPRMGGQGSPLAKGQDPAEREADRFAILLAAKLDQGHASNAFRRLVLIAEPRFLGRLRERLSTPTAHTIDRTVSSDIAGMEARDIASELDRLLGDATPVAR